MDARHVSIIYQIASNFKKILEIGCFVGVSTSGLVQAINDGSNAELHLCDVRFLPPVLGVVEKCRIKPVLHKAKSVDVISSEYDLIIVDGDHSVENVSDEVGRLLTCKTPTIIAHDTSVLKGPEFLKNVFKSHPLYRCLEDSKKRPGENTARGLFFATTDDVVFAKAQAAFDLFSRSSIR